MDVYLLSIIIFIAGLIGLLIKDRKKVERNIVLFTRRTKRGRKLIDNIAKKNPRFWKILGTIGIIACLVGMVYGPFFLINNLYKASTTETKTSGLSLVLPSPSQEVARGPGYLGVPFWYWIIPIALLIFVHEGMHGIMMRNEKLRIKSLGLLLLAVIPGAFVEPDEKQLKKKNWLSQLRIYAAGSFGNFLLAGLVALIFFSLINPVFFTGAISYGYLNHTKLNVSEPFPAQKANMTGEILSLNGKRVENIDEFGEILKGKKPGEEVSIKTTDRTYKLNLTENPKNESEGFVGIKIVDTKVLKEGFRDSPYESGLNFFVELLIWIIILNIGIGIVNLLPLKPLDGGLMFEVIAERFLPSYKEGMVSLLGGLTLTLIIGNFLGAFL